MIQYCRTVLKVKHSPLVTSSKRRFLLLAGALERPRVAPPRDPEAVPRRELDAAPWRDPDGAGAEAPREDDWRVERVERVE